MKKTRHTPEQIIRMLRQAEVKLAAGSSVAQVARELGISEATFHRWKARYGGMNPQEAKRLKELEKVEKENARLKRLLAEKELDIDMLREVSRGNF
jgi:putative transposase